MSCRKPSKHWQAKNERRLDLINKKHKGGGLTDAETAELATLKHEIDDQLEKVWPLSTPE